MTNRLRRRSSQHWGQTEFSSCSSATVPLLREKGASEEEEKRMKCFDNDRVDKNLD